MKKLLSIVLALALCLTAMMGCFVVSAETAIPTITVSDVNSAPGTVEIAITGTNFSDVCAADLVITLDEGLTDFELLKDGVALEGSLEAENGVDYVVDGQTIRYLDLFNGFDGISTTTLNLTVKAKAAADGVYDVTTAVVAATIDEEFIEGIIYDPGVVTIVTPCAHENLTYKDNGDGTHTSACANTACTGGYTAVTEGHTYVDGVCVCDAVEEEVTPCAHNYEVTEATAAIGEKNTTTTTTPGSLTETCTLCGHTIEDQTVYYSDSYRANYVNLDLDAEISFQYHVKDTLLEDAENVAFKTSFTIEGVDPIVDYKTLDEAPDTMRGNNKDIPCQTIKTGIAAKYMTDSLTLNTFVKLDGVWYSGRIQSYTIVDVAQMNKNSTDSDELALYANLLNYGGEAQKYFKYKLDNLANSADNLGVFADYVASELPEIESDMVNNYTLPTVRFSNFKYALESKIALKLAYRLDTATVAPDVANLKTVVSYTYAGIDGGKEYTSFELYDSSSWSDRYCFYLDALSAKQMRTPFTVTIYDGENQCNASFTGSIAGIAKYLIDSGSAAAEGSVDLFYAMISYGDAAAAYFA